MTIEFNKGHPNINPENNVERLVEAAYKMGYDHNSRAILSANKDIIGLGHTMSGHDTVHISNSYSDRNGTIYAVAITLTEKDPVLTIMGDIRETGQVMIRDLGITGDWSNCVQIKDGKISTQHAQKRNHPRVFNNIQSVYNSMVDDIIGLYLEK